MQLLLIPTQRELDLLAPQVSAAVADNGWRTELVGFGPIAAAARTADLVARHEPSHVCLIGIAGSYGETLPVGTAAMFSTVHCFGVGAGSGRDYLSNGKMGWPMIDAANSASSSEIVDTICGQDKSELVPHSILTCCSAAGSDADVAQRRKLFPNAVAEDMEAFGVALSCDLAGVPWSIVRGISNHAGDREHKNWQIENALRAAADLAIAKIIASASSS